ncbi:hypothetical protein KM043_011429 [Ampulex compressa]|nr:hypothetical protein KM043_011429 [Ampulex compressa]
MRHGLHTPGVRSANGAISGNRKVTGTMPRLGAAASEKNFVFTTYNGWLRGEEVPGSSVADEDRGVEKSKRGDTQEREEEEEEKEKEEVVVEEKDFESELEGSIQAEPKRKEATNYKVSSRRPRDLPPDDSRKPLGFSSARDNGQSRNNRNSNSQNERHGTPTTVLLIVFLLVIAITNSVWSHHHHHGYQQENEKGNDREPRARNFAFGNEYSMEVLSSEAADQNRRNLQVEEAKGVVPFSPRRLEKMLEKAILKIITGDLSTADMLLLKSLNYSLEEVLAIRERELNKQKKEETRMEDSLKSWKKSLYNEDMSERRYKHRTQNSMEIDRRTTSSKPHFDDSKYDRKRNRATERSSYDKDFDFEAYNRQAVIDYENLASKLEFQQSWSDPGTLEYENSAKESRENPVENIHRSFDRAMEPHVVFKIRYDDSEFDSSSNSDELGKERVASRTSKHRASSTLRHTTPRNAGNSFHASSSSSSSSPSSSSAPLYTPLPVIYQLNNINGAKVDNTKNRTDTSTTEYPTFSTNRHEVFETFEDRDVASTVENVTDDTRENNVVLEGEKNAGSKSRVSEYEGLEWVEDDVYRVIPAFADSLGYENNFEDDEPSDYDEAGDNYRRNTDLSGSKNENDTLEYQNDTPDAVRSLMANGNFTADNFSLANLSTYQQLAIAHRRDQGQKAIEDIKSRVLALTGRFNLSTNTNQVQRERLAMFSPTCQIPRNSDPEAWADPFSMNMHFQLNLTTGDHVVAAKLRIFKLPQENLTSSNSGTFEEDEEDEKKIRISIFYYTKSLKKHRSKKRLMDSVVTSLTPDGTHLALDVRQGLRYWRLNSRNTHGNGSNHGLVIQVEDQDGRPLKPALYIQQPSCAGQDSDQKTSAYLHFSFEPVLVTFAS